MVQDIDPKNISENVSFTAYLQACPVYLSLLSSANASVV